MPNTHDACLSLPVNAWNAQANEALRAQAVSALEQGKILLLPQLNFVLDKDEQSFLRPDCVGKSKSVKYSLAQDRMWSAGVADQDSQVLKNMLRRFTKSSVSLISSLFPGYVTSLIIGNTSFRPVEAQDRVQSKRHDDRLLHVDAFPSRPMQGKRILRVFSNVNPAGKPRHWRAGEPFTKVVEKFMPRIKKPLPGSAALLHALKITKQKRSLYDHYMLHIHDRMKLDDHYQASVPYEDVLFPPGSTWIVYSDQVSHAAMSGQYMMEQTFTLPVAAMNDPATSPLKVLEGFAKKALV